MNVSESALDADGNLPELFRIDLEISTKTLRDFGFNPDSDDSLAAYRIAAGNYMEDPDVKNCTFWFPKYCG